MNEKPTVLVVGNIGPDYASIERRLLERQLEVDLGLRDESPELKTLFRMLERQEPGYKTVMQKVVQDVLMVPDPVPNPAFYDHLLTKPEPRKSTGSPQHLQHRKARNKMAAASRRKNWR